MYHNINDLTIFICLSIEENHVNLIQDKQCPGWVTKRGPPVTATLPHYFLELCKPKADTNKITFGVSTDKYSKTASDILILVGNCKFDEHDGADRRRTAG